MLILNEFPKINEFYEKYWGKQPFAVRGAIDSDCFDEFIDGDTLAGLSLDEDIKSRLVLTNPDTNSWTCQHGPFDESKFETLGESNWSLLVQNIDQYHPATSHLLRYFNFSPRWLMDDIMVSYSAVGGSVGPHTDSYHVFLVQGKGVRRWKIGCDPIENKEYIDNDELLVLKDGFEGDSIEVGIGDVIYIPPNFGHCGVTLEEAMTFSVGFLGPKYSEILSEYSHYLEQNSHLNKRYIGQDIDSKSSAFSIAPTAGKNIRESLIEVINGDNFSEWMAEYFSTSTHDEFEDIDEKQGGELLEDELLDLLQKGGVLTRPEYIKIVTTESNNGVINLSVYGNNLHIPLAQNKLVDWLNAAHPISVDDIDTKKMLELVTELYNREVLTFPYS